MRSAPLRGLGDRPGCGRLPGVDYVERSDGAKRRLEFIPNDPLVTRQWYLNQIRAFDAWQQQPSLPGVRIAVLDSGIDAGHPEFRGRIADARSFIGGSALEDRRGHGTFVAGLIAAATGNNTGIAGIAFPSDLLVAKIARQDGTITLEAEARAIRWAVDNGARVINLSLAGVRDPFRQGRTRTRRSRRARSPMRGATARSSWRQSATATRRRAVPGASRLPGRAAARARCQRPGP